MPALVKMRSTHTNLKAAGMTTQFRRTAVTTRTVKTANEKRERHITALLKAASEGKTLGNGLCDDAAIQPATLTHYLHSLAGFWEYVASKDLPTHTAEEVDMAARKYVNFLFLEMEPASVAETLRAALEAADPGLGKHGSYRLPLLRRAILGFSRAAPTAARLPTVEVGLDAICEDLLDTGVFEDYEIALATQTMQSTYLRPGECFRLSLEDLVGFDGLEVSFKEASNPLATHAIVPTLLVCPFERGRPSKNREFDQTVAVEDVRAPWLSQALGKHRTWRLQQGRRSMNLNRALEQPLFRVSQKRCLERYRAVGKKLGLSWMVDTLHQLRHGGPSRDVGLKLRTLPEAMRRGRWNCLSSLKIYEQQGRLASAVKKIPLKTLMKGKAARRNLKANFLA